MRFLILADIHGNSFGLEAVLCDAQGRYDRVLCLGDVIGYGAQPNECCAILREAEAECLLGNHDAAVLGAISSDWFNDVAAYAVEWTAERLSRENAAWLSACPPQSEWPDFAFQAVHGSLLRPLEEYVMSKSEARPTLSQMKYDLCFFGHTHVATVYEELNIPGHKYSLHETPLKFGGEVKMERDCKYLINPGSCGQPRDGNPQARYGLFDANTRSLEVRAVDYDIESAYDAIIAAGLPRLLGERLFHGK